MSTIRYNLVVGLCWLLRHPDRRVEYAGGLSARTRCPCGHIDVLDVPFTVRP